MEPKLVLVDRVLRNERLRLGQAPEKERTRGLEWLAVVADVAVHRFARPRAVLEATLDIFLNIPGSLSDPVEREVLDDDQRSHAWKNSIRTGAIATETTSWR